MVMKNNSCSKSEVHSDAYETCTPFKSKSTTVADDDPSITYSFIKFFVDNKHHVV